MTSGLIAILRGLLPLCVDKGEGDRFQVQSFVDFFFKTATFNTMHSILQGGDEVHTSMSKP